MPVPYQINQAPSSDPKAPAAQLPTTEVRKIYPPCDVEALQNFSLEGRKRVIFSCAQFRYVVDCVQVMDTKLTVSRPEKDHAKQLHALALLLKAHPELFASKSRVTSLTESPTKEIFDSQSEWLNTKKSRQEAEEDINEDEGLKLVLLGSARHREDLDRVEELRDLAVQLGIEVCFLSLFLCFYSLFWIL
jgi:hypothetical protein